MNYGISLTSGVNPSKIAALDEAVRHYGALPVIHLIEYPEFDWIAINGEQVAGPEPKRITFRLERTRTGWKYVEQLETKEKCDKRA